MKKESSSLKQRGVGGERKTAPPAPAPVRERDVWNLFFRRINAHPSDGTREELRGYIERLGPEAVLLGLEAALDDNNAENMNAVHEYLKEKCYVYGLVVPVTYLIHTTNIKTAAKCFRGQILPGACEY